jgi:hypothetical protein
MNQELLECGFIFSSRHPKDEVIFSALSETKTVTQYGLQATSAAEHMQVINLLIEYHFKISKISMIFDRQIKFLFDDILYRS